MSKKLLKSLKKKNSGVTLPNGKTIKTKELVLRGKKYGRNMRRSIWKNHFPGLQWSDYLELEDSIK